MKTRLSRSEAIERYGLCASELMPTDEWEAYEGAELADGDKPDEWRDYCDE